MRSVRAAACLFGFAALRSFLLETAIKGGNLFFAFQLKVELSAASAMR